MTAQKPPELKDCSRLVVKIGSSLLIDAATGQLNRAWLDSLVGELERLHQRDQQVIIVSSGAIALGRSYLGFDSDRSKLEDHQAAAAAGQILLAHAWQELLGKRAIKVAQILLTLDDTENRRRYLNARNTIETLLASGVIPVINENDTVATQEIRYGDNDRLAARVAEMTSSDCLVLLSDVDGLYDQDPTQNKGAQLIRTVVEFTPELQAAAGASNTEFGSGGMATKLEAARICFSAGCATVIAGGRQLLPLQAIEDNTPCTWFIPSCSPRAARKQWIAGTLTPAGKLIIDDGAEGALESGRSLLPIGVVMVEGEFQRGDAVVVTNAAGRDIARGLAAYSSTDARVIQGRHSKDIESLLGYRGRNEIIHRDNLVLLDH